MHFNEDSDGKSFVTVRERWCTQLFALVPAELVTGDRDSPKAPELDHLD